MIYILIALAAIPMAFGLLTLLGQALPHILGTLYRPLYLKPPPPRP